MEFLAIIGLILWIVSAAAKRQQAKRAKEAAEARAHQAAAVQQPAPSRLESRHPLEPSEYTGHAHMETSMTGTEPCPPAAAAPGSTPWQCKICGSKMSGGRFCELCGAPRPAEKSARPVQRPAAQKPAARAPQRAPLHAAVQTVREASAVPVSVELDAQKPVFNWEPARVRDGLLYAEILGAPRAKRPLYPARRA